MKELESRANHLVRQAKDLEDFRLREGNKHILAPTTNLLFQLTELVAELINELKKEK